MLCHAIPHHNMLCHIVILTVFNIIHSFLSIRTPLFSFSKISRFARNPDLVHMKYKQDVPLSSDTIFLQKQTNQVSPAVFSTALVVMLLIILNYTLQALSLKGGFFFIYNK